MEMLTVSAAKPRVLFISHSASRNGATILLLSFLRWLRPRVDWEIEVLMNGRGPLLQEFEAIAKTTVWRDPDTRLRALLPPSMSSFRQGVVNACARLTLPNGHFDLVYANTTAAAPLVGLLGDRARTLLWHVHELAYAMKSTLTQPSWVQGFGQATRYVAVSEAVRAALASEHGIDDARIDLVHGFIDSRELSAEEVRSRRANVRARLGISEDAFVVGGCGSLGWRKGSDLFLQIARHLASTEAGRDVEFLWVGGTPGEPAALEFEHDARSLALGARCRLVTSTADVLDHYCAMDAFALTSREDPFPLVVLEAADHGVPTLCFTDAGGANEFVANDAGVRIPYLDVAGFAAQIAALRSDRPRGVGLGECARTRVRQYHRLDFQGPKLLLSLQRCLPGEAASGIRAEAAELQTARTH
jgi:glycosyltransferase involved in cell wall biosynthesis